MQLPAILPLTSLGQALARIAAGLGAHFAAERLRWPLWIPVALGFGIALYFLLPLEPPLWLGPLGLGLAFCGALVAWRDTGPVGLGALLGAIAFGAIAFGFTVAQWRSESIAAPVLETRWGPGMVAGRVISVETLPAGKRVVLDQVRLRGLEATDTPARIRIRIAAKSGPQVLPGGRIRVRASLMPPPAPVAPGAFDFQRYAWFQGLGAVGYALGTPQVLQTDDNEGGFAITIAALRTTIAARVRAGLPGRTGAVAAALLTGDRGAIPEDEIIAMRESGLAHLLAISGLHIGLVASIIFFGLRAGLALVPGLALNWPIKKIAALAAIAGAFGYLVIAGATVPTQRAFLMIGLVFLAVLLDRTAMSMRLVAWAAAVVLLVAPESLLSASFQLSFAAVVALIAAYEALAERLGRWRRRGGGRWWRGPALYVAGVAFTTLVAGAATGIFAIYHFNQTATYGLAANLLAVPIMALWVMPWGLAAFLALPFGIEAIALVPMGWGIDAILAIAQTVSGWSGSVALVPAMPVFGLALVALGGLWLTIWQGRWRLFGAFGILAGLATVPLTSPPDILVSADARLIALRTADGRYMLSNSRVERFAAERWLRQAGEATPAPWPREGKSPDGRLICDAAGCIYRLYDWTVAVVNDERALAEDCWVADLVVSVEPVRRWCPKARLVIDRFDMWREGSHAIWIGGAEMRVESVNRARGRRPWVPRRKATVRTAQTADQNVRIKPTSRP